MKEMKLFSPLFGAILVYRVYLLEKIKTCHLEEEFYLKFVPLMKRQRNASLFRRVTFRT